MAGRRREDNPAYRKMVAKLDPIKGEVEKFKQVQKNQYDAFMLSIEEARNAAIIEALDNGLKKNAICQYFGITAGHAQDAFMVKVGASELLARAHLDASEFKIFEQGDWRVRFDFINHDRVNRREARPGPNFSEGRLWNDVLELDLRFALDFGDDAAVTYFRDGALFDGAHIRKFGGLVQGGYTAFDDGTFYEYGEPGKWFTEGADIDDWLEFGYRNKREGWPQP